jgi:hypothetical protein
MEVEGYILESIPLEPNPPAILNNESFEKLLDNPIFMESLNGNAILNPAYIIYNRVHEVIITDPVNNQILQIHVSFDKTMAVNPIHPKSEIHNSYNNIKEILDMSFPLFEHNVEFTSITSAKDMPCPILCSYTKSLISPPIIGPGNYTCEWAYYHNHYLGYESKLIETFKQGDVYGSYHIIVDIKPKGRFFDADDEIYINNMYKYFETQIKLNNLLNQMKQINLNNQNLPLELQFTGRFWDADDNEYLKSMEDYEKRKNK